MSYYEGGAMDVEASPVHVILLLVAIVVGFGFIVKLFLAFGTTLTSVVNVTDESIKRLNESGIRVEDSPFYRPLKLFTSLLEAIAKLFTDPKTIAALLAAGILSTVVVSFSKGGI